MRQPRTPHQVHPLLSARVQLNHSALAGSHTGATHLQVGVTTVHYRWTQTHRSMHACTHTLKHTPTLKHKHTDTYTHACIHACTLTHARARTHTYTHTHAYIYFSIVNRSSSSSQQEALLDLMWSIWPEVTSHGRKAVQFVDLLGYFTIKTPQISEKKVRHSQ